ncbi:prolipoprotein diacylglyceryl transferase [Kitasatospora atroaurantiaca]|uniref:Prolipoprotein diacylglyceryl transferase n=2 Tax=Kitasatospora atroaurantiaca TaxID=285545 RepID=A0A561F023_9ACTN|nr:prolipoprotein diacylglyceryl transferase [Kitasatospora atroaurantiaca]
MLDRVNALLDASTGMQIRFGPHRLGSWETCLVGGFVAGTAVWVSAGLAVELPVGLLAALPACWAAAFLAVRFRMLRTGVIRLVWHRHALVGVSLAVATAVLTSAEVHEVLDVWSTGCAVGLAIGRLGCHRSGCCLGRAALIGPRYQWLGGRERHLPLQLAEALWCLVLAVAGGALLRAAPAGTAASVVAGGYTVVRVPLHRLRAPLARGGRRRKRRHRVIDGSSESF